MLGSSLFDKIFEHINPEAILQVVLAKVADNPVLAKEIQDAIAKLVVAEIEKFFNHANQQ